MGRVEIQRAGNVGLNLGGAVGDDDSSFDAHTKGLKKVQVSFSKEVDVDEKWKLHILKDWIYQMMNRGKLREQRSKGENNGNGKKLT